MPSDSEKDDNTDKTNEQSLVDTFPYYMVVTAKYGATDEYKEFIDNLFGDNAEEKFRNYFQWFNVVHELTHGLITYNGDKDFLHINQTIIKMVILKN